jgi:hypothetical protein
VNFNAPDIDYAGLSPIIALTAGLVLTLFAGLIGGSLGRQRVVVSIVGIATLGAAIGLEIWQWGETKDLVAGALRLDHLSLAGGMLCAGAAIFVIPLSWREQAIDRPLGPAGPDLAGVRIAVLGAAFKPNTDDVRNSPGLAVAKALAKANADIVIYDPEATKNARRELPDVEYVTSLAEAVTGADLTCVVTAWDEFRRADPNAIGELASARRIIDGMNCLDHVSWIAAGWDYRGMGRPIL